jgi:hypothetical protein
LTELPIIVIVHIIMTNTITVNGRTEKVLNTLSSGPGQPVHTYELRGGSYVYEIAGIWWLQEAGQFKRRVEVA